MDEINDYNNISETDDRREIIKQKLRQYYDGRIVRKDLTKSIREGANVPVYVLEYLLGQYCNSDDQEIIDEILLVLFGSTLSSIISYPLTTQGQMSAVGTIVSAGYGFICGAYMPISNFGKGLQKGLSYVPSTYGTSMLKNHMLRGVFEEMKSKGFPDDVVTGIADSLDCNPVFRGHVVSSAEMLAFMVGTIVVLGIIYQIITALPEK